MAVATSMVTVRIAEVESGHRDSLMTNAGSGQVALGFMKALDAALRVAHASVDSARGVGAGVAHVRSQAWCW